MTNQELLTRLKYLRKKKLNMSQEEFGCKIGLSKSNISNIEIGRVELTDRNISMICKEFNVNEVWLRTGEGGDDNMFTKINNCDKFAISLGKLTRSENKFVQNAINYLADAEPEKLEVIEELMKNLLGIE